MEYVKITKRVAGRTVIDLAYLGNDEVKAFKRFYRDYPDHTPTCINMQVVDDNDPKWVEWFKAARACGCVYGL